MLSLTVERACAVSSTDDILIITNRVQRDAVVDLLDGRIPSENVIGEPVGRNTAPCIALAAVWIEHHRGDRPMLVLPADHLVSPVSAFAQQVGAAAAYVSQHDALLTFGIMPARPDTGYGYIHAGEVVDDAGAGIRRVEAFVEKPSAGRALELIHAGDYFWNSGMFLWRTSAILGAISRSMPDLTAVAEKIRVSLGTKPLAEVLDTVYPGAPSQSIDYGVMEQSDDVVLLESKFEWNDVGSWEFMREAHEPDREGNSSVGSHVFVDAADNTVISPDRLVAVLGLSGIAVVDAGDTVLVCPRTRVQEVKRIVRRLHEMGREDLL